MPMFEYIGKNTPYMFDLGPSKRTVRRETAVPDSGENR